MSGPGFRVRSRADRGYAYFSSTRELEAYLRPLDPFTADEPCACGSRSRTRNTDGAVFCQRCGKKHEGAKPTYLRLGSASGHGAQGDPATGGSAL